MRWAIGLCLLSCALVGCGPKGPSSNAPLPARLQAENPGTRAQAVVEAGEKRDEAAVPYLVDRLTDTESDIRMLAIIALQKITGQTMGYKFYEPADERAKAVARWRQWLEKRGPAPTSAPASMPAVSMKGHAL